MSGRLHFAAFVCILPQMACGVPKHVKQSVGIRSEPRFFMQLNVAPAANGNNPIPMDLVMVMDKKVVQEVSKLAARDWFARRTQVQRDHGAAVEVVSWEWVPGQSTGPISVAVNSNVRGAYLFANYLGSGDNRAVVDVASPVVVNLLQEGFTVQPLK